MKMKFIEQVKDFKLIQDSEQNIYFIIKILNSGEEILITKILLPIGAQIPSMITIEDHLQNFVLDFEEYKHFIQLVDEAYFRLSTNL